MTDQTLVRGAADLAQQLIHQLHQDDPEHPTFEQVGLLDGKPTVDEFLDVGELGCALSHLLYMIHEADISFPKKTVKALHELAERIGERNHYSVENVRALTEAQRRLVYNRLE